MPLIVVIYLNLAGCKLEPWEGGAWDEETYELDIAIFFDWDSAVESISPLWISNF